MGDDKNVEFTRITNGALDIHWNRTWADIVSLGIELSADGKSMLVSAPTNRTFTIEVYY